MARNKIVYEILKDINPVIKLPWDVLCDIQDICKTTEDEIGWIGECVRDGDEFLIKKVTIPKQQVHSTTTEISDEGILEIMDNDELNIEEWRYWGHSHCDMGVFPSGQDIDQMRGFSKTCKWFVGTIHNYDGDIYGYIVDNEANLFYKNVPVEILYPERSDPKDWEALSDERVTKKYSYAKTGWSGGSYGYYGSGYSYGSGYNSYSETHKKEDKTPSKTESLDAIVQASTLICSDLYGINLTFGDIIEPSEWDRYKTFYKTQLEKVYELYKKTHGES